MWTLSKTFNGGTWTQGRYDSFVKGLIRAGLQKWGPKIQCIKNARTRRGFYKCEGCLEEVPATIKRELKTKKGVFKRTKNIIADHIEPIIDPAVGRGDWDTVIKRAFVEIDGFQALCHECSFLNEIKTTNHKKEGTNNGAFQPHLGVA